MSETQTENEAVEVPATKPGGVTKVMRFVGRILRGSVRVVLLVVVPLIAGIVGIEMYVASGKVVNTENAYVKAEKVAISSDVEGRVQELSVKSHARVNKGDVLFRLDRRPFEIAVAKANAELGVVANEIRGYQSAYRMEVSEQGMANEDLAFFQREFERQRKLSRSGIVSKAKLDEAQHDLQQVRQRLSGIREQIGNALSRLGDDPDQAVEAHPRYLQALAERDSTQLRLDQTVTRAPDSGVLGTVELQAGEYVEDGQPVFSIVANSGVWVTANLKETQLTYVQLGQQVIITADTYPDRKFEALVDSIAPATGAEFSLLPPQNASGNWVKVVQRIPVTLVLKNAEDGKLLRAGMSVTAEISTGHERKLPEFVRTAMAMIQAGKAQMALPESAD